MHAPGELAQAHKRIAELERENARLYNQAQGANDMRELYDRARAELGAAQDAARDSSPALRQRNRAARELLQGIRRADTKEGIYQAVQRAIQQLEGE